MDVKYSFSHDNIFLCTLLLDTYTGMGWTEYKQDMKKSKLQRISERWYTGWSYYRLNANLHRLLKRPAISSFKSNMRQLIVLQRGKNTVSKLQMHQGKKLNSLNNNKTWSLQPCKLLFEAVNSSMITSS